MRTIFFAEIVAERAGVEREQRAAPYSMRSTIAKRYTIDNNVRGTHNVLAAIVASGVVALLSL